MITPDSKGFPRASSERAICDALSIRRVDPAFDYHWSWKPSEARALATAKGKGKSRGVKLARLRFLSDID